MKHVSINTKIEIAMQMVIMDAMEKGHTKKEELVSYMDSETFKKAVKEYLDLMQEA